MSASELAHRSSAAGGRPQSNQRPTPGTTLALRVEITRPDPAAPRTVLVQITGEIDCYTATDLKHDLFNLVDGQGITRVDLDMATVDFIDSTGLGVLVATLQRLRADGGELHLRNLQRGAAKVIELTGLSAAFHVGTPAS